MSSERKRSSERTSGVLLHVTSLPSPHGIGDLGPTAYRFVDFLERAGQRCWQILPLGPTGYRDSPYQSPSTFAGNPLMLSPELMVEEGILQDDDVAPLAELRQEHVDFCNLLPLKNALLEKAFAAFDEAAPASARREFETFTRARRVRPWLDEFALFMALKDEVGPGSWLNWEAPLKLRDSGALQRAREVLAPRIRYHSWLEFMFQRQWSRLRQYANTHGVDIVGDTPIFVALDSADVWANRHLFKLDEHANPRVVAGVPPDYFSATGQLWGNPIYEWKVHQETGFTWWIDRVRAALNLVDRLRIDHFRGFEASWEIPAGAVTAIDGAWIEAPGHALFEALSKALGPVPLIAEDLGVITPPVEDLRDAYGFPGMKILQFAWGGGSDNKDLPHNYVSNCVVYSGTHDNDTSDGWFASEGRDCAQHVRAYLGGPEGSSVAWTFIKAAMASIADTAIFPLQDVLALGTDARMNFPGREEGNWTWRCPPGALTADLADRLGGLTRLFGRCPT